MVIGIGSILYDIIRFDKSLHILNNTPYGNKTNMTKPRRDYSKKTLKVLFALSGNQCAYPECANNIIEPATEYSPELVTGQICHIHAVGEKGPRGKPGLTQKELNSPENLILLCPNHHTLVDKAPEGKFPAQMLLEWKAEHEREVDESLAARVFSNRRSFGDFVCRVLAENHACWTTYGPESAGAQENPNSTAGYFWPFRKLSVIVPNNRRLISAIRSNQALLSPDEYRIACRFIEHAEGFEHNCTVPIEDVPRFPVEFEKMFLRDT